MGSPARRIVAVFTYRVVAAGALEVDPGAICLVACHVWDTIGAAAVGWQTALVLREGNAPSTSARNPISSGRISMRSPTS